MLLGPARTLMEYAGLNEACIIMILTEWERERWEGGKERGREGGRKGEGVRWGEEEKTFLVEIFTTKIFLRQAFSFFFFPFLSKET